ncbi:EboA domain-containing protein [Pseudoalteromonas sp. T1lg65]|uniref:EboA domain-containing protein n=1 Tax=Pseudoalteromonas sp. T1lg65 TaxID=2077101 RepID=UPI003F793664
MHTLKAELLELRQLLTAQLAGHIPSSIWLSEARQRLNTSVEGDSSKLVLANLWADLSADVPHVVMNGAADVERLPYVSQNNWTITEWVRFQLLAELLLMVAKQKRQGLFEQCLRYGDDNEKQALLKGLMMLDTSGVCKDFVVHLCRTNNTDLFASIALRNPWAAMHFTDLEFEQLVLKALFCHFDLRLISGLEMRHTPRLSQLAFDYLCERLAANRDFPESIFLVVHKPHLSSGQLAQLAALPNSIQDSITLSEKSL